MTLILALTFILRIERITPVDPPFLLPPLLPPPILLPPPHSSSSSGRAEPGLHFLKAEAAIAEGNPPILCRIFRREVDGENSFQFQAED